MKLITSRQSPNYNERDPGSRVEYIILHYTECDFDLSLKVLTDGDSANPVSSHYLICEEGKTYQLVDDNKQAWHAGKSYWQGKEGINTWSIGIELVNPGHGPHYRPFSSPQLESCLRLCQDLMKKYAIPVKNVLGHSDIACRRKVDPGELFDWQGFAKEGVGIFPSVITQETIHSVQDKVKDIGYLQNLLGNFGYHVPTGVLDESTSQVITAFQRRFYPQKVDGDIDAQLIAKVENLLDQEDLLSKYC